MLHPDELMQDPALKRLDKSGRELVLAFADSLGRSSRVDVGDPDPLFKQAVALAKSNPQPGDVHVASELTNLSVAYMQDQGNFQASSAGVVPVERQSDAYVEYDRLDMFRVDEDDALRGPASESAGSGFDTTLPTYSCKVYAWHKDVDEQLQGNQRVGDPVDDALAYVTQIMLIIREKVWALKHMVTAVWGQDLDGVPGAPGANQFKQWDQATATPRDDLSLYAVKIHESTGYFPNLLALQPYVLKGLVLNAQVIDAFKYTVAGAQPSLSDLARALFSPAIAGMSPPTVKLCGGIQTTSRKGAAAPAVSYIVGKHALLAYVNDRPGLRSPSAFYTFAWTGLLGANAMGVRIKDFPIDERAITHRIEGEMAFDTKQVSSFLGAFFETAVA